MTYVIINGHHGLPSAVFAVAKETPKRYYGDVADTISGGDMRNWFWLRGLTKNRVPGTSYVLKEIVAARVETLEAWHKIKDELAGIADDYNTDRLAIERTLSEAREVASTAEIEARVQAKNRVRFCLCELGASS